MSGATGTVLTAQGRALQAKAQVGAQLQFTRVKLGDGVLPVGTALDSLTDMVSAKLTVAIQDCRVIGDGTSRVRVMATNESVDTGFPVTEIGLFATDPQKGEILYSIVYFGDQTYFMPGKGGSVVVDQTFDLITVIGNAQNVVAVINERVTLATKEDITVSIEEHDKNPNAHNLLTALHLWQKGEVVAQNEIRFSAKASVLSYKFFECTVGGTCGATEPNWPAVGQTIVDGSVTWRVRDLRSGSGMPIGHTFQVLATTPPPGCLDISGGALVSRATHPDFWAWVQTSGVLITEVAWQAQAAVQSSVGFYSSGDGSTTFRLPKLTDFASGTDTGRDSGTWRTDDLRKHTHRLNVATLGTNVSGGATSMLFPQNDSTSTLDAGGTETRPKSISMMWCVKAFDAPTNQGLIDITAMANDLAALKTAQNPTVSVRQTVLSSSVDINGNPNYITPASGLAVNVAATAIPVLLTAANGEMNRNGKLVSDTTISGLTNAAINYLYADIAADGSVTLGATTLAPVYQNGGTFSVASGQFTFNISTMTQGVGNGTTSNLSYRVFIGEAVCSGGAVAAAVNYALKGQAFVPLTALPTTGTFSNANINIGTTAVTVSGALVCQVSELGYAIGDEKPMFGTGNGGSFDNAFYMTARGLVLGVANWSSFLVENRATAGGALITLANWKWRAVVRRAW